MCVVYLLVLPSAAVLGSTGTCLYSSVVWVSSLLGRFADLPLNMRKLLLVQAVRVQAPWVPPASRRRCLLVLFSLPRVRNLL